MPAAMRNPMSVVKPTQTPAKPNTDGAHNRTSDDMTPTAIYRKRIQEISEQLKNQRIPKASER
jgi:hypothetical protein